VIDCPERDELIAVFQSCALHLYDLINRSDGLRPEAFARAMGRLDEWKRACDEALREIEAHRNSHGC